MICVDTSVWVEALRGPASALAFHLGDLIEHDVVLLPAPVKLELMLGVSSRDRAQLDTHLGSLDSLVPNAATWRRAERWTSVARPAGEKFAVVDLLIAAVAAEHGATVWSRDTAFERMARLGFVVPYTAP